MGEELYGVVYLNVSFPRSPNWDLKIFNNSKDSYVFSQRQNGFMLVLRSETAKYRPTFEDQDAWYKEQYPDISPTPTDKEGATRR